MKQIRLTVQADPKLLPDDVLDEVSDALSVETLNLLEDFESEGGDRIYMCEATVPVALFRLTLLSEENVSIPIGTNIHVNLHPTCVEDK